MSPHQLESNILGIGAQCLGLKVLVKGQGKGCGVKDEFGVQGFIVQDFQNTNFFYSLGFRVWRNFLIHVIGDLSLEAFSNLVQRKKNDNAVMYMLKKVQCSPVKNAGQIKGKM